MEAIAVLNEDCIIEIMQYLNLVAILAFGATNVRHRQIISNAIARRQAIRGPIGFTFDLITTPLSSIREILLRFGDHIHILIVNFRHESIDMALFQDDDGSFVINNGELLTLLASVSEATLRLANYCGSIDDDDGDYQNENERIRALAVQRERFHDYILDVRYYSGDDETDYYITEVLHQFQRNAKMIVMAINDNRLRHFRRITFKFSLILLLNTYRRLHATFHRRSEDIDLILNELFSGLRYGNMTFDFNFDVYPYTFDFILEFNL